MSIESWFRSRSGQPWKVNRASAAWVAVVLSLAMLHLVISHVAAQDGAAQQREAVESALRAVGSSFRNHDAAAVANAWTEDGVYVDPASGVALTGRDQIRDWYARIFQDQPQIDLKAQLDGLEFEGDGTAFVRGTATVSGKADEPTTTSFLAELVKVDGRWLLRSVEENDPDPLNDLEWLVGNWEDDSDELSVQSSVHWDRNGRYLVREYQLSGPDRSPRSGTQFIVWDANRQQIRTWAFDSEGSFAEGTWTPAESHWSIQWQATLADGRLASATQLVTPIDGDSFQSQWMDVDVDGIIQPGTDRITVRRVQDKPGSESTKP